MTNVQARTAEGANTKPYDLFVSYVEEDSEWVEGYLLDALGNAGVTYIHESAFALGAPRVLEFQRAVEQSRHILLVLSSAYFASSVTEFSDVLAQTYGQESGTWPVIPLRLEDVEVPPRLKLMVGLDAIDPEDWADVVERLCQELRRPPPAPVAAPPCPYPGMTPFTEAESDHFFGRSYEVDEVLQQLRLHPFLAVIGPSGSGKSSLVAAGVVPALRTTTFFGGTKWVTPTIRPGAAPLAALEAALGGPATDPGPAVAQLLAPIPNGRVLLVVDQLEELFTVARSGAEEFQQALLMLTTVPSCTVMVTMRADFYPQLMATPLW
ncbi:MAG: toll/interleukin-1 receptor domain-containing protein, partial [Actinomycetota bacterium]|nr:toll/interleukin-1 receptor domain-containing protein [Actinomycetota bacterium]